ncbi:MULTISPECIES: hypothetical protein [unclassified Methylobacterium]|uniref:hypothetical protein n=1 Tax=unclassified Methylobacterium TaxID=2615210 RepID=UPI0036F80090
MTYPQLIPMAEAAAFTIGCAVIVSRRFDPQRVGAVLAALLFVVFLVFLVIWSIDSPPPSLADPSGLKGYTTEAPSSGDL